MTKFVEHSSANRIKISDQFNSIEYQSAGRIWTFVWNSTLRSDYFCHHFRARDEIVICVISSSIAILLLFDEHISHSRFKISLQIMNETICNIIHNTHLYEFLRRTKLIIRNEISMQHKHCFTFVHHTFTNLMQNKHTFDDIFMILSDDFAQILFVVSRDNREAIVDVNIQQCFFWARFRQLILRQNMRVRTNLQIRFLRIELIAWFMSSRYTIVLSFREKSRKWLIYDNLSKKAWFFVLRSWFEAWWN